MGLEQGEYHPLSHLGQGSQEQRGEQGPSSGMSLRHAGRESCQAAHHGGVGQGAPLEAGVTSAPVFSLTLRFGEQSQGKDEEGAGSVF